MYWIWFSLRNTSKHYNYFLATRMICLDMCYKRIALQGCGRGSTLRLWELQKRSPSTAVWWDLIISCVLLLLLLMLKLSWLYVVYHILLNSSPWFIHVTSVAFKLFITRQHALHPLHLLQGTLPVDYLHYTSKWVNTWSMRLLSHVNFIHLIHSP